MQSRKRFFHAAEGFRGRRHQDNHAVDNGMKAERFTARMTIDVSAKPRRHIKVTRSSAG
jgi:hypothetical protein